MNARLLRIPVRTVLNPGIRFWGALLLVAIITGSNPAFAQQLIFTNYSYKEGLKTYNIRKVIQDKYGYVWVATQSGLYRFNGDQFDVIQRSGNAPGQIRENVLMDMAYPGGDSLYLATFMGGIDLINIRTLEVKEVLPVRENPRLQLLDYWVYKISLDRFGDLWIGGRDYLAVYRRSKDTVILLPDVIKPRISHKITFLKPVNDRVMAVGTLDQGILLYETGSLKFLAQIRELAPGMDAGEHGVFDLLIQKDADYIAMGGYLLKGRLRDVGWQFEEMISPGPLENATISCLATGTDGHIWIGTNAGLGRYDPGKGRIELLQANPFRTRWLADNTINDLMMGKQGMLWIASQKSLQSVNLNRSPFTIYSGEEPGNSKLDHVYSLVRRNDTGIFACGTEGLYEVALESHRMRKIPGTASLGITHHIVALGTDRWLLSTDKGSHLYRPSDGSISQDLLIRAYPEWAEFRKRYFNTSMTIGSQIYLASEEQEGLFIWDTATHVIRQFKSNGFNPKGIPENHIHNVRQDREGNVWILMDEFVARYDRKRDTITQIFGVGKGELNSRIVFDMYDDGETIWFGTFSGGLNGYNKKTSNWSYITRKDGLSNDCVYSILPEHENAFWVSTNYGISRVNVRTKSCINYYFEDGLQDNAFDENGSLMLDRTFLLGGVNGFTAINLDAYKIANEKIPVYIDRVKYIRGDKKVEFNDLNWKEVTVPPGTNSIIIHLSALCYTGRQKVRFSYRIVNLQDQYLDVSDDNTIVLNSVAHGNYELQIRYSNERGQYAPVQLRLPLHVLPAWYETWWFKALLIGLAFGLGYGFYRLRINQIMKQQQIRKDVAADLHDDIGSNLNSVKVFAHLAMTAPDNKEYIRNVEENLEHATVGLRDMIWILDDKLDSVEDLSSRLHSLAAHPAEAIGMFVHFTISDGLQNRKLGKPAKRNLFLIAKEAINNSVKYSSCKNIWVTFRLDQKKLLLILKDDGRGFNAESVAGGYGLHNMKSRAEQIHFECDIRSGAGGTEIRLREK